jgi:hypothetical protein
MDQLWPTRQRLGLGLFVTFLVTPILMAGLRGPGKYSGVVFFDRWDNCILFDGVYLMYISDKVKDSLRSHEGQSVQIDAQQVSQPVNPGDGLIRQFTFLGPASGKAGFPTLSGIGLKATREAREGPVTIALEIRNGGPSDISLYSGSLGFAVLAHISNNDFILDPSDGSSYAVITRASLESAEGTVDLRVDGNLRTYAWKVDPCCRLPSVLHLTAGQTRTTKLDLSLPSGAYQFIAGIGEDVMDGQCVMSNAVSFDISNVEQR